MTAGFVDVCPLSFGMWGRHSVLAGAKVEDGELVAPISLSAVAEEPCWRASAVITVIAVTGRSFVP